MARISLAFCVMFLVALSTVYEVQGTFLLRHYLRKFPRRSRNFQPFACKGMLKFVDVLEVKCPLKAEYKDFFGKLRAYMGFISSASGSKNFNVELKGKVQGLQNAMSAMGGKGGSSADTSKVMDVLLSMGKTLGEQRSSGSTEMTFGQRKELIMSMAKWARVIGQFVSSAAAKTGNSIDLSSLGLDGIDSSSTETGDSVTNSGSSSTESSKNIGSSTQSCTSSKCSTGGGSSGEEGTASARSFKGNYERSANYQQQSNKGSTEQTSTGSS